MHEVSLRSSSNRMDAHNLAVVLCPNLVSGPDPIRDVMMCVVPGGPALYDTPAPAPRAPTSSEGKTTLGAIIKLCIQRYYEVFDEILDPSEALPRPSVIKYQHSPAPSSISSGSRRHSGFPDDDEEIDDAMLVMAIGPSVSASSAQNGNGSNASSQQQPTTTRSTPSNLPYVPRNRNITRSMHTAGDGAINSVGISAKAKSVISIDNGRGLPGSRKGSISVGRGTTRKSSGAGVEAIGVTAGGFFTPPSSAPPVPVRHVDSLGSGSPWSP